MSRVRRRGAIEIGSAPGVILITGPMVLALLAGTLALARGLEHPGAAVVTSRPDAATYHDLEPIVVDVLRSAGGASYRLAGRPFDTAPALTSVLRQLVHPGEGAFVRIADDATFADAEAAVRACEQAGFATVALLTDRAAD